MALIKDSEQQNNVNDLDEKAEQVNKCQKVNNKKKIIKTVCIVAGMVIVLCVAVFIIYYMANKEQISISKAEEYTTNQQYEKVIEILEEYKNSNKAKQMYDDAVFLTSEEGKFIIDFASGLEYRWKLAQTQNYSNKEYVNAELNKLNKYDNVTFKDADFNEKAHAYIQALKLQLSALSYVNTDYTKYSNLWDEGFSERSILIAYFLNNYPVPIDDKYADVKLEFQSTAKGIEAQNEFESKIDMMIHKDNFKNTKSLGDWETYEITLTNETDKVFTYFGLYVNCLDTDGKILSQESTSQINGFSPGQTATFEFSTDKHPESLTWTANYYIE